MQLCTFEIRTHLGRHQRLGAITPAGIVDLNFACAAWLERAAIDMADVSCPPDQCASFSKGIERHGGGTGSQAFFERAGIAARLQRRNHPLYTRSRCTCWRRFPNPASLRDFFAFEAHVKTGFEKRGEPMPKRVVRDSRLLQERPSQHHRHRRGCALAVFYAESSITNWNWPPSSARKGRNIPAKTRRDYIAGFTVMNDFSARDIQRQEMKVRLGPAKGKDWCTALGPWLVTPDEIGDPYNLR